MSVFFTDIFLSPSTLASQANGRWKTYLAKLDRHLPWRWVARMTCVKELMFHGIKSLQLKVSNPNRPRKRASFGQRQGGDFYLLTILWIRFFAGDANRPGCQWSVGNMDYCIKVWPSVFGSLTIFVCLWQAKAKDTASGGRFSLLLSLAHKKCQRRSFLQKVRSLPQIAKNGTA